MTIHPAHVGALGYYTAPATTDPFLANVMALLHFDGTNGSTTIVNSVAHGTTWTCGAGCSLTTTGPKWGTACLATGAGNSGLTSDHADYTIGTQDFTAEVWFQFASLQDTYAIDLGNAVVTLRLDPKHTGGSINGPYVEVGGAAFNLPASSTALSLNVWHHLAISRTGGSMALYIDGVRQSTGAANSSNFAGTKVSIGKSIGGGFPVNGLFDDFRLTIGVGRYSGTSCTVPSAAFPDI